MDFSPSPGLRELRIVRARPQVFRQRLSTFPAARYVLTCDTTRLIEAGDEIEAQPGPESLTFSTQAAEVTSAEQGVTLRNTGKLP
ncbi:MAG TPA: hypothetical protein VME18_13080 [Acidobacteriaceae bacterium]|nr:hypothetical protein [Acidobacteriaceae bacterium]